MQRPLRRRQPFASVVPSAPPAAPSRRPSGAVLVGLLAAAVPVSPQRVFATRRPPAPTVPKQDKRPVLCRLDTRRFAGLALVSHIPAKTVRLSPAQLTPTLAHRDERGFKGAIYSVRPPPRATIPKLDKRGVLCRLDARRFSGLVLASHVPAKTVRLIPEQLQANTARRDDRFFRGAVYQQPPSRSGSVVVIPPRVARQSIARRDERNYRGQTLASHVPARTVRLSPVQLAPTLCRRDERRFAGLTLVSHVPDRTVRLSPAQLAPTLARRDERGFRGAAFSIKPPPRATVPKLDKRGILCRRDDRGFKGAALVSHVPAKTTRLSVWQLDPSIARRDDRGFAGRTISTGPTRTGSVVVITPRVARQALARRDERLFKGAVWTTPIRRTGAAVLVPMPRAGVLCRLALPWPRLQQPTSVLPRRITVRLSPWQLTGKKVARQEFAFKGAVWIVGHVLPKTTPRLPKLSLIRRDQRGYPGWSKSSPSGRFNSTSIGKGNPRSHPTLRARPLSVMTLRAQPLASMTLRARPTAALTYTEG